LSEGGGERNAECRKQNAELEDAGEGMGRWGGHGVKSVFVLSVLGLGFGLGVRPQRLGRGRFLGEILAEFLELPGDLTETGVDLDDEDEEENDDDGGGGHGMGGVEGKRVVKTINEKG
jgi:hypothetical protein